MAIYYKIFEQEAIKFVSTSGFQLAEKYSPAVLGLYTEEARESFANLTRDEDGNIIEVGFDDLEINTNKNDYWMDLSLLHKEKSTAVQPRERMREAFRHAAMYIANLGDTESIKMMKSKANKSLMGEESDGEMGSSWGSGESLAEEGPPLPREQRGAASKGLGRKGNQEDYQGTGKAGKEEQLYGMEPGAKALGGIV